MAHLHCRKFVANNCGLPARCAQLCQDSSVTSLSYSNSGGKMNGWVNIWQNSSSVVDGGIWRKVWAVIESNRLSFFDSEGFAASDASPIQSVNLDTEHWRIYNQTTNKPVVEGVTEDCVSMLIEIKLPRFDPNNPNLH